MLAAANDNYKDCSKKNQQPAKKGMQSPSIIIQSLIILK